MGRAHQAAIEAIREGWMVLSYCQILRQNNDTLRLKVFLERSAMQEQMAVLQDQRERLALIEPCDLMRRRGPLEMR